MPKITAEEILDEVRNVVKSAFHGKRKTPTWVTAYQVLIRLPGTIKDRVITDHGEPGKGSSSHYPASQVVKDALLMLYRNDEVAVDYLDSDSQIVIEDISAGKMYYPGNVTVAIYRFVG